MIRNLILSLTGTCNYACVYCYAAFHPTAAMQREIALQAVDMAGQSGLPFILQFTGGEPLLAFDVLRVVTERVEERGYPAVLQLQTNASLLTDEIAVYLKRHGIAVGVSLDGRPAMNDALRKGKDGNSASEATIRGIRILAAHKIAIGLTCVVTRTNVEELSGIIQMAYYLGNVRQIGFDLLRCQGRGAALETAEPGDVEKAVREVYTLGRSLEKATGVHIRFSQMERMRAIACGKARPFGHCYSMHGEGAYVAADGKIYACSSLVGIPEFLIGDLSGDGFDIKRAKQVGDKIAEAMQACRECSLFRTCGGGCFTRWRRRGGKAEEECAMQRVFAEQLCKNPQESCCVRNGRS